MAFFKRIISKTGRNYLGEKPKMTMDEYLAKHPPLDSSPPRPLMTPPSDGTISVAIQRDTDSVWVWVLVTETTKQTLSKVLSEPVDEYPLDIEQANQRVREYIRQADKTWADDDADTRARHHEKDMAWAKKEFLTPRPIRLRDMLMCPFRYHVASAQEAAEYTERLKAKVFPRIKSMIESQARPQTETFEL